MILRVSGVEPCLIYAGRLSVTRPAGGETLGLSCVFAPPVMEALNSECCLCKLRYYPSRPAAVLALPDCIPWMGIRTRRCGSLLAVEYPILGLFGVRQVTALIYLSLLADFMSKRL